MELNFFAKTGIELSLYLAVAITILVGAFIRYAMLIASDKNKVKFTKIVVVYIFVVIITGTIFVPVICSFFFDNEETLYKSCILLSLIVGISFGSNSMNKFLISKNIIRIATYFVNIIKSLYGGNIYDAIKDFPTLESYKTTEEFVLEKIADIESRINNALDTYITTKDIHSIISCYNDIGDDIVKITLDKDSITDLSPLITQKYDQMMKRYEKIKNIKDDYFDNT